MGEVVIPYKPRPLQKEIHDDLHRFSVIVCHRRFGKTVLAINELIRAAFTCQHENPRVAYIAPLYRQAKQVAWDYLRHFTSPIPRKVNESELRIDFNNGARVQLYGGDSPDSLRGIYLDMVVLDEYAQMSPRLWSEIIRPTLSDRKGRAIFIGTPRGHNNFYDLYQSARELPGWQTKMYRASETGIVDPEELEAAKREMTEAEYAQEYECSWSAAIRGAYYGQIIAELEGNGHIREVSFDPTLSVETWWDLGIGDSTAIWFVQRVANELHVIDYYENQGEGLPHYAKLVKEKPYVYSQHVAPHDIEHREFGSGKTRREIARSLGIEFTVAPKQPLQDGIEAVRTMLPRCWFDDIKCRPGLEALRQYRVDYDDKLKVYKKTPLHDWSSHASDAFRYGAITPPPVEDWGGELEYQSIGMI